MTTALLSLTSLAVAVVFVVLLEAHALASRPAVPGHLDPDAGHIPVALKPHAAPAES